MSDRIRYAVAGLGHISQVAVLPAFEHAERAELVALISGDRTKLDELGARYRVPHRVDYRGFDALLDSGEVDAVYIALPNHLHREYTERAARAGVHVLCEKPMAPTEVDCERMIRACEHGGVKLMIAYRLHYQPANLRAVEVVRSGSLGPLRLFTSTFGQDVKEGDIRLAPDKAGGTLYDIGIYCINAARYLFGAEPIEVYAASESRPDDPRFDGVDEMSAVVLRFPGSRLATFVTSFGTTDVAEYRAVGTLGRLRLDRAYSYVDSMELEVTIGGDTETEVFPPGDQFAPEIDRFAECIQDDLDPEPDGLEGLADVRIIEAAYRSAREGYPIELGEFPPQQRPDPDQESTRPPVEPPEVVHETGPHR